MVENGNITKAGKKLDISQPAVSRLIGSLEETLGFPLFQRLAGRLRPTSEARIIFDEVEKALANLNHVSRLMEDIQDNKAGHLRVACLPGFATSLLPRILASFLVERPGLGLTFEPRTTQKIQEWILAQQFNVGISDMFEESPSIESEPLLVRTVFIAPQGHPLAVKKVVTPKDMDGLPMIHGNRDQITYSAIRKAFNSAGAEFNSIVETRLFATACIMVAKGIGVSIVSEIDAREYENQGLVIRPFEPNIPFEINILYPAYMPRSIATREFVEAFKQGIKPFCL
ncbi:MAG: LysR family transcriptional regulator [Hyphomicrobiales bacterium]|nr:LysR family transcriptional regulator [Hyphomicrobiales bacterium]